MPTNRNVRSRHWRPSLDPYKREQLLFGPETVLLAGVGYYTRHGPNEIAGLSDAERAGPEAEMERDWRTHRADLLAWWNDPAERLRAKFTTNDEPGGPGTRPWAAERFDGGRQ